MKTKVCNKCGIKKPLSEYHKNKGCKYGVVGTCKECNRLKTKAYYNKNKKEICKKEKIKRKTNKDFYKTKDKKAKLKSLYGISLSQHKEMWINQNGCCALCETPVDYDKIAVDHNHVSGDVRDLLCYSCNTALGLFHSDEKGIELLEKAVEYIRKHNG